MKKYINRQARDEKRAEQRQQQREARASRKAQELATIRLGFHVAERTFERLIESYLKRELSVIENLNGEEILKREALQQKFILSLLDRYGMMIMPVIEQLLALEAAQSGLELEEDDGDDGDGVAAAFAAMAARKGGLDYDEAEHYHEHLDRYDDDSEEDDDIVNLG